MSDPHARVSAGLAALREDYLSQLGPLVESMHQDWWRCRSRRDPAAAARLHQSAHRLYGSGATFGFPELSDVAAELEERLDKAFSEGLAGESAERIDECLKALAVAANGLCQ
jgi:HPt (histidine-containing phosphotransfer) domain-containing protein